MKIKIRMTDDSNLLISWEENKNNIYIFIDMVCSYFLYYTYNIMYRPIHYLVIVLPHF